MRASKLLLLLTLIIVTAQPTLAQSEPAQPQQSQILRIISNPVIWRKDFPSVLKLLNDLKDTGESKVVVYANQVEGTRKFSLTSGDALREASELHLLMNKSKSELKPEIQAR